MITETILGLKAQLLEAARAELETCRDKWDRLHQELDETDKEITQLENLIDSLE